MFDNWTKRNKVWQGLTPFQKAAAMSLMEADGSRAGDARNVLGAMVNRSKRAGQDIGFHVSQPIYQPVIEPSQEARLTRLLNHPEFGNLTQWAERRSNGLEPDNVSGATHYLVHPKVMVGLSGGVRPDGRGGWVGNSRKYHSWPRWTGYDPSTGQYKNQTFTDESHAFLAPEGAFSAPTQDGAVASVYPTPASSTGDTAVPNTVNTPVAARGGPTVVQPSPAVSKKAFNAAMAKALLGTQLTSAPGAFEGATYALAKGVGAYAAMGEQQDKLDKDSAFKEALAGVIGNDPMLQTLAQHNPEAALEFALTDKKAKDAAAREEARLTSQETRADERLEKQLASEENRARAVLDKEEYKWRLAQMGEANDPKNIEVTRNGAFEIYTNKVTGEIRKYRNGELVDHKPGTQPIIPGAGNVPAVGVNTEPISLDGAMPPQGAPRVGPTLEVAASGQLVPAGPVPAPQEAAAGTAPPAAPTPPAAPAGGASALEPAPVAAPPGAQPAEHPGFTPGKDGTLQDSLGYYNIKPSVDGKATPDYLLRGRHLYSTHNDAWKEDYARSSTSDEAISKNMRAAAEQWRRMKPSVELAERAVKSGTYTGKGGELVQTARGLLSAVGIDMQGQTDAAVIDALSNRFVPAVRQGLPGAVSNYEMQAYLKSVSNLGNTPEANFMLLHFMKKVGAMSEADAKIGREFKAAQRKAGVPQMYDDDGFGEALDTHYTENPIFDDKDKQLVALASSGAKVGDLAKFVETGELPSAKGAPGKNSYSDGTVPRGRPSAAMSADGTMAAEKQFPGAPPVGTVVGGHVYAGGDPNKESSWRPR